MEKESLSHDVRRFRFALPDPSDVLGLPTGQHMFVSTKKDGKLLSRPYTPVSSNDDRGFVDFIIKIYSPDPPRFPDGGALSQHLDGLSLGDTMDFRGPIGKLEYKGKGVFQVGDGTVKKTTHIGLIAGGTGITPILQVVRAIIKDPSDTTKMSLIFANKTEDDIFLRKELEEIAESCSNFKLWYTVDTAPAGWKYGQGFIDYNMISENMPVDMPNDSVVLCCGPKPMIDFACRPNLEKCGYPAENVLCF